MRNISAANQVQQISDQLLQSYIRRDKAQEQATKETESIQALRNILGGIELGRLAEQEVNQDADEKGSPELPEE